MKWAKILSLSCVIVFCGLYFLNKQVIETKWMVQENFQQRWIQQIASDPDANSSSNFEDSIPEPKKDPVLELKRIASDSVEQILEKSLQTKNPDLEWLEPRKLQIIILTTWRSGSTFLEEVFEAHPGMYNIYEPLYQFGFQNIRPDDKDGPQAKKLLYDLIKCRYRDEDYLKTIEKTPEMLYRNNRIWSICQSSKSVEHQKLCSNPEFLENSCQLFQWTVMKLVRAEMSLLQPVMDDVTLNAHIIFLVRDPRGVMNSRISSVNWCKEADCSSSVELCDTMSRNLDTYSDYKELYGGRVHLLRYEDLCQKPTDVLKKLFNSIGLTYDNNVDKFVRNHVNGNSKSPWSVSKKSQEKVLSWTKTLAKDNRDKIQSSCSSIMDELGYLPVIDTKNIKVEQILRNKPDDMI